MEKVFSLDDIVREGHFASAGRSRTIGSTNQTTRDQAAFTETAFCRMSMIKIAYIIDELPSANGGTEGQLVMLLRHLDRSVFTPHLVCLRPADFISKSDLDIPNLTLLIGSLFRPSAIQKISQLGRYLR